MHVALTAVGAHPVPGGEFPPPPAAANLISQLPPPDCFHVSLPLFEIFISLFFFPYLYKLGRIL